MVDDTVRVWVDPTHDCREYPLPQLMWEIQRHENHSVQWRDLQVDLWLDRHDFLAWYRGDEP